MVAEIVATLACGGFSSPLGFTGNKKDEEKTGREIERTTKIKKNNVRKNDKEVGGQRNSRPTSILQTLGLSS